MKPERKGQKGCWRGEAGQKSRLAKHGLGDKSQGTPAQLDFWPTEDSPTNSAVRDMEGSFLLVKSFVSQDRVE